MLHVLRACNWKSGTLVDIIFLTGVLVFFTYISSYTCYIIYGDRAVQVRRCALNQFTVKLYPATAYSLNTYQVYVYPSRGEPYNPCTYSRIQRKRLAFCVVIYVCLRYSVSVCYTFRRHWLQFMGFRKNEQYLSFPILSVWNNHSWNLLQAVNRLFLTEWSSDSFIP